MVKAKGKDKGKSKVNDCIACDRRHASPTWYGKRGSKVCKGEYEKQRKILKSLQFQKLAASLSGSVSWRAKLVPQVDSLDETGYPISSAQGRPDCKSLALVRCYLLEAYFGYLGNHYLATNAY
jgi:hypothetical protein